MVSFIVPVYNPDLEILKKCLKSLFSQSYKDFEVIAVLDGPSIVAEAALDGFRDIRLKRINMPHGGACRARNEGYKASKGDIVWFWDCDCIIEPDTCKTFIDTFKEHPEASFLYSGYKFLGEKGGIPSEPFDPWTLKCGNYVSTCFPMRREAFPGFDENIKAFQDWDVWLTIVEKGGKGLFIPGHAFSTKVPDINSISGRNFTAGTWLERVKAIKGKHNLPDRKVCVSSLSDREEGIRLAKLIDADFKDVPNYKPNNYETVIQVGFSLHPSRIRSHTGIFTQVLRKKIIFWTRDNIAEIQNSISFKALRMYSETLNRHAIQFVEDMYAKKVMESAGFNVSVLPIPMVNTGPIVESPAETKVLLDITEEYRNFMNCILYSLPDIKFDYIDSNKPIKDYSAMVSLHPEGTMSFNIKRMLLNGKNIISNVQDPFCGYVNSEQDLGKYISEFVDTIRKRVNRKTSPAIDFWSKQMSPNKLMEVLK